MPILATIIYFAEYTWAKIFVFLLVLLGLYIGGVVFADTPLSLIQFLALAVPLAILALTFELFRRRINLAPGRLTEIAKELHKTLDLQQLMLKIMEKAVDITQAQRGLIIIINPRNKQ